MSLRTRISLALAVWLIAETLTLALVVDLLGVGGAILLGVATSVLGASLLKRLGMSALAGLRQGAGPGGIAVLQGHFAVDGTLAALGAVFLLIPGFLTDAVGIVLAVPSLRARLAGWIQGGGFRTVRGQPRAQHGPTTIDLDREDWRSLDDKTRRPTSPM